MTKEERKRWKRHPQYAAIKEVIHYPTAHLSLAAEAALCTFILKVDGILK